MEIWHKKQKTYKTLFLWSTRPKFQPNTQSTLGWRVIQKEIIIPQKHLINFNQSGHKIFLTDLWIRFNKRSYPSTDNYMHVYNEFCIFSNLKCWYMISLHKLIFLLGFAYVLRWLSCLVHQPWFYSFQVTVYFLFLYFSGETICLIGFVIVRKRERDKRKNEVWTYMCINVFTDH